MKGWATCPVVGTGTDTDPFRGAVADLPRREGDRLEYVIGDSPVCLVGFDIADPQSLLVPGARRVDERDEALRRIGRRFSPTFDERLHLGNSQAPPIGSFLDDQFPDANGTSITSRNAAVGGSWARQSGWNGVDVLVQSQRGYLNSSGSQAHYNNATPASAEYDVAGQIYVASDIGTAGSMVRMETAAKTGYECSHAGEAYDKWTITKHVAGVSTELAMWAEALVAGNTRAFSVAIRDTSKKLYVAGVERCSTTDNAITAAGKAGTLFWKGSTTTGQHLDYITATNPATDTSVIPQTFMMAA